MQTETHTDTKKRREKLATTTALANFGLKTTTRLDEELTSDDEGDGPRRRKGRRKGRPRFKVAAPVVTTSTVVTDYMTTIEAAAYLKLSRQFLEGARYRGDGSGPAYIKLERAVRYRRSVLDAWMSAHHHSPDKPSFAE